MSTRRVNDLLKKTEHFDADERYMATNDLIKELNQINKLDERLQTSVRKTILKRLEDKHSDVSTIAVKTLETLVAADKFNQDQIVIIVEALGGMLVDKSKTTARDIYSEGLVSVLKGCNEDTGKKVTPKLLQNINKGLSGSCPSEQADCELACMQVLVELLKSFGGDCTNLLSDILNTLLKLLAHPYESARMQASETLGPMTPYLDPGSFKVLMNDMISKVQKQSFPGIYINCIVVMSKYAALRVADYLDVLIPTLLKFLEKECEDADQTTQLWSACLEAFNSLIQRCPNKSAAHIDLIIKRSMELLKYDPNLADDEETKDDDGEDWDDDDGEDWGDDGGEDWGDDDGGNGGGGDNWGADDEVPEVSPDESWKIRQSAVRVISTFIIARSDLLSDYASELTPILIQRFTERDSVVQEAVFHAYQELLHEALGQDAGAGEVKIDMDGPPPLTPQLKRHRSFYADVYPLISDAIDKVCGVFSSATVAAQKAIYGVLSEIAIALKKTMGEHFKVIMPHVLHGLTACGKSAVLNEYAIDLTRKMFKYNDFKSLQSYIGQIANASIKLVDQAPILVKPKGLLLCGMVAQSTAGQLNEQKDLEGVVEKLYEVTYAQLEQKEMNEGIKIASITAMSLILSSHGGFLGKKCKDSVQIIQARLGNSVTQVAALQAITQIANAGVSLDFVASSSIGEISAFLRKVSSQLKQEAMICLDSLVRTHGKKISTKDYGLILQEVQVHICEADLQLAGQGLNLMSSILANSPGAASQIAKDILPKAIQFVKCPLLHGNARQALSTFFQHCVEHGGKEKSMSYSKLLVALKSCKTETMGRPGSVSVAQCIAGITLKTSDKFKTSTVKQFISEFSSEKCQVDAKQIALLSIGEIGHELDLSGYGKVFAEILKAFDAKEVAVREAASFALGNVTVGSMETFMKKLIDMIRSDSNHEYLLLCSMKENIISHQKKVEVFKPHVDVVMELLCDRAESKDEGIRKVTSECLGRLGVIAPAVVIPKLNGICQSDSAETRAVAITALRFSLQGGSSNTGIRFMIGQNIETFFKMLTDDDLEVKREAVLTTRKFCVSSRGLINRMHLSKQILPALYSETKAHPELIHVTDYGNFKVTVDEGLPLRKAVYQTLDALLDNLSHLIDMKRFNNAMKAGLADADYDVQIMTYNSYEKLAVSHPEVLLEMLDDFPKLIMSSVKGHLKQAKTKEPLRAKETLRVIVSVMLTFNKIKGVEQCKKYGKFYKQVCQTKLLKEMLKELTA